MNFYWQQAVHVEHVRETEVNLSEFYDARKGQICEKGNRTSTLLHARLKFDDSVDPTNLG